MPCYDPGVQIGEVKAPYCVIHDGGIKTQDNTGSKLGQQIWEIVVLVPIADQPSLRAKCRQIKQALAAIRGLKDTGEDAPTGLEASYKGAAQSLIYRQPVVLINK
jgi:hypothetical protein